MKISGKTPQKYPFRGGAITAKEAADHFGISIKTIYNRLAKCGDNMDAVFHYYENAEVRGGVKRTMKKLGAEEYEDILQKQKEEKAVNDLAELLCGERRIPKETIAAAPQGYASVKEIDVETGVARLLDDPTGKPEPPAMELELIKPAEKEDERRLLGLYNAAISALTALNEEIEDFTAGRNADELLDQLRQLRINTFEHLVPWDKLAEGGVK